MNDHQAPVQKAWAKEKDGEIKYKIQIDKNGQSHTLYADQLGNWIDKDDKKDKDHDRTDY